MADDIAAKLTRLAGDVTSFVETAQTCAREGHQYQLHASKTEPTRVTCKRCPRVWQIKP